MSAAYWIQELVKLVDVFVQSFISATKHDILILGPPAHQGPLSKRRLLSANRSLKNTCEKKDQLRSSPISQRKRGHNRDDSHHSSNDCEDVFC